MMTFDKIEYPYPFSSKEQALIKEQYAKVEDWDKSCFDNLKSNIIAYLRQLQGNKCCYCKRILDFDKRCVEIEHIVSKRQYPLFGFESLNLALACPACNSSKTNSVVLTKTNIDDYPTHPEDYLIIHPHFDNYSEHINILDDCVFFCKK